MTETSIKTRTRDTRHDNTSPSKTTSVRRSPRNEELVPAPPLPDSAAQHPQRFLHQQQQLRRLGLKTLQMHFTFVFSPKHRYALVFSIHTCEVSARASGELEQIVGGASRDDASNSSNSEQRAHNRPNEAAISSHNATNHCQNERLPECSEFVDEQLSTRLNPRAREANALICSESKQ